LSLFDIIIGVILLLSALIGLARGAMREMTNVAAFVLAVFIAVFGLRFSGPFMVHSIHIAWAANIAAVVVVFLVAYIILRIIGGMLTGQVRGAPGVGPLDRILGLGFGLVRGLVLVGVIALLLGFVFPGDRMPQSISSAKLFPLAQASAMALKAVAPKVAPKPADNRQDDQTGGAPPSGGGQNLDSGYTAAARKGLDEAVEKSR
jgi:membrane protein required for colicin V production